MLLVLSTGLLLMGLDNSILYTGLYTVEQQLGASPEQGLWIINAYPLVVAGLMLGTGTLGDRVGHARMFTIGLVCFGVASACCAYAPTPELLILARGALGAGAAAMTPATLALIQQIFTDARERNIAVGMWSSVATVGSAAGPVVGGYLLEHFWWGSIFLVNVPIVLLAMVAMAILRPANVANPEAKWDAATVGLSVLTLISFTLLLKGFALFLLSTVLGGWLFVRRQAALEQPLLEFSLFRNRIFSAGVAGAALSLVGISAVQLLTIQRFQAVEGFSPLHAGVIVSAIVVASIPTSVAAGIVLHRTGYRPLIAGGIAVTAAGTMLAALNMSHLPLFVLAMCCVGAGAGAVFSASSTAIISSAPSGREGMAASVEEMSYELGALTGVAALGTLMVTLHEHLLADADVAAGSPEAAFDLAYVTVLSLIAVLLLASAAAAGWLLREKNGAGDET